MWQAYIDIQLLLTHSIEPWTRSRAPICLLCLRQLVQLAFFRFTLISPQYMAQFENDSQFHARELLIMINDARGVVAIF